VEARGRRPFAITLALPKWRGTKADFIGTILAWLGPLGDATSIVGALAARLTGC
jgi:hypothetical protein